MVTKGHFSHPKKNEYNQLTEEGDLKVILTGIKQRVSEECSASWISPAWNWGPGWEKLWVGLRSPRTERPIDSLSMAQQVLGDTEQGWWNQNDRMDHLGKCSLTCSLHPRKLGKSSQALGDKRSSRHVGKLGESCHEGLDPQCSQARTGLGTSAIDASTWQYKSEAGAGKRTK